MCADPRGPEPRGSHSGRGQREGTTTTQVAVPGWLEGEPVVVTGSVLERAGLPMPVLAPASAVVLHLTTAR